MTFAMRRAALLGLWIGAVLLAPGVRAEPPPGWVPVWGDEFDGGRLDPDRWIAVVENSTRYMTHYDAAKARVRDGFLVLTAGDATGAMTGGQVRTGIMNGRQRGETVAFTPPIRIDMLADYELVHGSAGSFWLYSTGFVPSARDPDLHLSKEFDIVELHGGVTRRNTGPDRYHHTALLHRVRDGRIERPKAMSKIITGPHDQPAGDIIRGDRLVLFTIEWLTGPADTDKIVRYSLDGEVVFERNVTDWPERDGIRADLRQIWDLPMHLVLTCDALELGSGAKDYWGAVPELNPADFPIDCRFDYVRAYRPAAD